MVMMIPDPEYSILSASLLARGERRLEGEAYLTGGYAIRQRIEALPIGWKRMDELAHVWQPGRLKGIAIAQPHGVPFLAATQVFDVRPTARKWLVKARTKDYADRIVEEDWILLTCSGTVGDAIISYAPHIGHVISHDLLRVQPHREGMRGYLYAFIKTRFGRGMLESSQYGSIIKHLEPEHVQAIPVLTDDATVYARYARAIKEVFRLRSEAFTLSREAEQLFARAVGAHSSVATEEGFEVPASRLFASGRRLDAYHHNPSAEAAETALTRSGARLEPLETVAEIFGVPRFKHIYTTEGIPYLDSEDLFKINPEIRKHIPETTKMRNVDNYYVSAGWLLMACSGQLYGLNGSVILATDWHEEKIVSNHVLRIVPDTQKIRAGYLQMALGHPSVGRPLVLRCAFGTEVPEIDAGELTAFPVARLAAAQENAIADRVERASLLRMKADEKETEAVARLEERIEEKLGAGATPFEQFRDLAKKLVQVPRGEITEEKAAKRARKT